MPPLLLELMVLLGLLLVLVGAGRGAAMGKGVWMG